MNDYSKNILDFFQKKDGVTIREEFISGEQIAKEMGFSRTAVWNHIDTLRKLGYEFESSPRLGYRLIKTPDRLFPDEIRAGLETKWMGQKIYYYDVAESTNDIADQLAQEGAEEGTLVLAEYQRGGRGRRGRHWFSPRGKNILLSLILRPRMDSSFVPLITVMSSVAVARAIRRLDLKAEIKWPNDIFVSGRKVAGILTEMKSEQDQIKHLVVGIGINVNMGKSDFLPSLESQATSLALMKGGFIDRKSFLREVLSELETCYCLVKSDQYDGLLEEWSRMSFLAGKWVEVSFGSKMLEGVVLGTDSKGALLLKLESGLVESIFSGDIRVKNG